MPDETWLIWIVDDSPEDRAEMKRALLNGSKRRYRFRELETGGECLRALREAPSERPTCLLLDDHLPDFNAAELLPALGGFEAIPFPVVVVTGLAEWSSTTQVLQCGAQEFVGKEWLNPGSLTRAVESAIERHALTADRKALEDALRISERRFRTLFDSAGESMSILGPGGFTECNPAMVRLSGCANLQELLGKGPMDFSPPTQPDGRNSAEAAAEHVEMAFRMGSHRFEWQHCRPDGSLFDAELLLTRIDLPEGPVLQAIARDITETKRARAESERLRNLLEDGESIAELGCWEYDVTTHQTNWSPGECRIYGIEPGTSPDYTVMLQQCIHPDDAERLDRTFRDALAEHGTFAMEHRIVRPDGAVRAVRELAHPRYDATGMLAKYVGVTLDETERKQTEHALQRSEMRLRLATEGARAGIWYWNIDADVFEWDSLCAEHLALPEGTTPSYEHFVSVLHPHDRERVERLVSEALENRTVFDAEYRVVHSDRSVRWIIGRGQGHYREDGETIGMTGVTLDITESKRVSEQLAASEERLRLALDAARMGTFDWDLATGRIIWSPEHEKLWGYAPGEFDGTYGAVTQRVDCADLARLECEVARCRTSRTRFSSEYRVNWPDGSAHWISTLGEFAYASDGTPLKMRGTGMDITERKVSEAAVSEAEAWRLASRYMRSLMEATLDPLITISADGVITDVNRATEEATGWPREHLIGSDFSDYLTEPERARAGFAQAFAEGKIRDFPLTIRHPSGRLTELLFNASRYCDEAGVAQGVFASARDITPRLRAERALRRSEESLRRAQSVGRIGSWRLGEESEAFEITEETARLFDLPADRPVSFAEWFARVHPDDQALVETAWRKALRGAPYDMTYRIVARGETVWIRALAALEFAEGGICVGGVGTVQDITSLKQAEQQIQRAAEVLRLATDAANIGVWEWDFAEDRLHLDNRLCDWCEVPESIGSSGINDSFWRSRLHPDDLDQIESSLMAAKRAEESWTGEFRVVLPEGCVHTLQSAAVIARQQGGAPVGMVGIARDVTKQRALEDDLRTARMAADMANQAKGNFLAVVSHEIRTPMHAVLGLAQLLERDVLTPDQRGMVQRIHTAGRSLLRLINDILDISKIEAGQLSLERQAFALNGVLSNVAGLLRPMAEGKGLVLRLDAPPKCDLALLGDAQRLEQVLVNLTNNAIKFTEQGSVELRVIAKEVTEAAAQLRFEVRDTGIGMTPEQQARLFMPFSQADDSITRRFGGTGLGLSISNRLVEKMGGTLRVESTKGVGSTFWFELGFKRAANWVQLPDQAAKSGLQVGRRLNGLRCLVVDDSALNREVIERALRHERAQVTLAADGRQALERLREQPEGFDLVLMDIQMPVLDGLSAARAIRGELGLTALPVIALTAGVLDDLRRESIESGINDFLVKPMDLDDLVNVILRWTTPNTPPEPMAATAPEASAAFPDIPGIDAACAARTLMNNRVLFRDLLLQLVAELGDAPKRVGEALATGDRPAVVLIAHRLRGDAGNLGATGLAQACQELEQAAKDDHRDCRRELKGFRSACSALRKASAPWLKEPIRRPGEAGEVPPLEAGQLEALRTALDHHDLAALPLFTALQPALVRLHGEAVAASLAEAVKRLRFAEALALLDKVT